MLSFQHTLVIILFCLFWLNLHVWCAGLKLPYWLETWVVMKVAQPPSGPVQGGTLSACEIQLWPKSFYLSWGRVFLGVSKDLFTPIKCFFPLLYLLLLEQHPHIGAPTPDKSILRIWAKTRSAPACAVLRFYLLWAEFMFLITQPKKCFIIHHKSTHENKAISPNAKHTVLN